MKYLVILKEVSTGNILFVGTATLTTDEVSAIGTFCSPQVACNFSPIN